jgi:3-oxoacyl-[acyl-carrier protein] reductase
VSASEEELIGHSYTRARKHPLVIGKLPGAGRLPGGPYTITQVMTMVISFGLLVMTRGLWAHFGAMNFILMALIPWGLAWVLRYARLDGRDPARAVRSLLIYSSTPAQGRLAGKPQRVARPRLATATCTVRVRSAERPAPAAAATKPAPAPVRKARPAPAPAAAAAAAAAARPEPKTGLQALLASLDEQ